MGTIVYLVGVVLTVLCFVDVFAKHIDVKYKILVGVLVLLTNWIGLIVYYVFVRDHLESWCRYRY